eukprot:SAG31_NODE_25125_length_467_cov_1.119565_2_plen_28_part_01
MIREVLRRPFREAELLRLLPPRLAGHPL